MSGEDLAAANERLASPPDIDTIVTDRVGFQVVGRLARQLGVLVQLQANPGGGLAAAVLLPPTLRGVTRGLLDIARGVDALAHQQREGDGQAQALLRAGHTLRFRAAGQSMRPFLRDGDFLTIVPAAPTDCQPGDIVLCSRLSSTRQKIVERDGRKMVVRLIPDRDIMAKVTSAAQVVYR